MDRSDMRAAVLGALAGAVGGIVQPAVGKLEETIFPRDEDTNIPRHFVDALTRNTGIELSGPTRWAAGAAFHVGYALFWGAAYGVACNRRRLSPLAGGLGLGAALYLMAFSRVGGATLVGSEPPPWRRPPRTWLLTTTMPLTYGLTTAWVYEKLQGNRRKQDRRVVSVQHRPDSFDLGEARLPQKAQHQPSDVASEHQE